MAEMLPKFQITHTGKTRLKIRSPILIKLAAVGLSAAMWLLFRTLRLDFRQDSVEVNPYSILTKESFFYCVWHDAMIVPLFAGKHRRTAALTSQHADGSFVAQVLREVGISAIRGSTHRISPGAIRKLIISAADRHIVITPDGPRGPRREMSLGIVRLASRTGRAIVPTAYSCTRCWRISGSWTDQLIPKPFSKVFLLAANPVAIPAELDNAQLQEYKALIQTEMDRLNTQADRLAGGSSERTA